MSRSTCLVACVSDQRAVSSVIGFILLFGLLVMLLAMYQAQIVPQQNAQAEFQHNQEVQDDLIDLRNAISTAGQADKPAFARINLGPTYETRVAAINPPPAAGTLRTSASYNITISNRTAEYDTNVSTRFVEYEPGYNEITTGSIWYEHSVLYVDERDERPVQILEDQNLVTEQSQKVRLTALQNEFETSGTERTKIELFPTETVNDSDIPTGELDVIIPTRLNKSEYWAEQLGDEITVQEDFHADGVHRLNMSNSTVHSDDLEFNTVGLREMPVGEQPKQNVGPTGQRDSRDDDTGDDTDDDDNGEDDNGEESDTITADSISNLVQGRENPKQEFVFTLTEEELAEESNVSIDVSEPNAAGVDYENATVDVQRNDEVTIIDGGDTIEFEAGGDIDAGETITIELEDIDVSDDTAGEFNEITFTRNDTQDSSTASFEITDTITADSVDNLIENEEGQEQTFEFTLETELENGGTVSINVSEPNAAGVAYDELDDDDLSGTGRDARIEADGDKIVFEAGGGGEEGEQSITVENLDVADESAGDFEDITFTRDDTDGVSTESFSIAESFDASVFVNDEGNFNNDRINTSFNATNNEQTFAFNVEIEEDNPEGFIVQEVTVDNDTYELTDEGRDRIIGEDDIEADILDASNYDDVDQSELDEVRDEINTDFEVPEESIDHEDRELDVIEVQSIE